MQRDKQLSSRRTPVLAGDGRALGTGRGAGDRGREPAGNSSWMGGYVRWTPVAAAAHFSISLKTGAYEWVPTSGGAQTGKINKEVVRG